jgi:AraC-like DNA-binding protein
MRTSIAGKRLQLRLLPHISTSRFYFKRSFGVAYQEYLDSYRIKLIEKRLEIGGLKLKQIAQEFGFTDVSHLSKVFRKLTEASPCDYRISNGYR